MITKREIVFNLEDYKLMIQKSPLFKTKGVVTFKPERKGLKSKAACCVIEVDDGIIDYYRNQVNSYYGLDLLKPSWSAHVSIIQGSIDPSESIYKEIAQKYEGIEVDLEYKIIPRYSGDTETVPNQETGLFWFLSVESDIFDEIRSQVGLSVNFKPHLTIGKKKKKGA